MCFPIRLSLLLGLAALPAHAASEVQFDVRSTRNGPWSDTKTWEKGRAPRAGDNVQVRTGHIVTYDALSDDAVRVLHVAGTLTFAREKSTRLNVGLLKVLPGDACTEDGFNCHEMAEPTDASDPKDPTATLEIGTRREPIPAGVTATIRLVHVPDLDTNSMPAVINCGGRWEVHGAPLSRTWVKLAATAKAGDANVMLEEAVTGWKAGDRVIVTVSKESEDGGSSYRSSARRPRRVETEERFIASIDGATLMLDKPLAYEHFGTGITRSEVANLSRNVVIESADPAGVRGHTLYHRESRGGISYAEFRHLGKEGLLGKYAIVYHPDYDAHVYRRIRFNRVVSEPINRAHDDESVQYGTFTYDDVRLENCRVGRDPLIQLACTSPRAGAAGHFRGLVITNSNSRGGKVVDLGGGPRNDRLQNPVSYYFHDYPAGGRVTKVVSAKFASELSDAAYRAVEGFTGKDVRAAEVEQAEFPDLLDPIDDLPPATMITAVESRQKKLLIRGVTQDNGEVASVTVNGRPARIVSAHAGVVDWEILVDAPPAGALGRSRIVAGAADRAGNVEKTAHLIPGWERLLDDAKALRQARAAR